MTQYFDEFYMTDVNGLLKARDAKELYEKFGFVECEATCMVCARN